MVIYFIVLLSLMLFFIVSLLTKAKKSRLAAIALGIFILLIVLATTTARENQRSFFKAELVNSQYADEETDRLTLEISLPMDKEAITPFEDDLRDKLGTRLIDRYSWIDQWFDYEIVPEPADYSGQYDYIPVSIHESEAGRVFLRTQNGIMLGNLEGESGSQDIPMRKYIVLLNDNGDTSDPRGYLKELKKEVDELLDIHFNKDYRSEHPW